MKSMAIVLFLTFLGCCAAFPALPDNSSPIVAIPVFLQEPESPGNNRRDSSSPVAYMLLDKLTLPEEHPGGALIEKRNVKKIDEEDLETAAGNFALRPLFVYRQQMANRQRVREANSRRNRF
ncbi:unnamed protein product [Xylocopa violacea]|uniref:Uncharacterized protein n=1 Tax=Xylocopa violacea TaxID=135666 RepID=A0ABP1N818_XYLVO